MGKPKMLLPWGDTSVFGQQIRVWQKLCDRQIVVVYATGDEAIQAELNCLNFSKSNRILNPQPELGMFSSIRCAANWDGWAAGLTHWVISLGDQPHLQPETLRTLLEFSAAHPKNICQPRRLGHLRHPVILPEEFFLQLKQTGAATFKEFLESVSTEVLACDIDDVGLDFDIDTPIDYERALTFFARAK